MRRQPPLFHYFQWRPELRPTPGVNQARWRKGGEGSGGPGYRQQGGAFSVENLKTMIILTLNHDVPVILNNVRDKTVLLAGGVEVLHLTPLASGRHPIPFPLVSAFLGCVFATSQPGSHQCASHRQPCACAALQQQNSLPHSAKRFSLAVPSPGVFCPNSTHLLAGHGSPARPPDTSPGCRLSSNLFLPPNEDSGKEISSEIWNQWLRKPSQESHFPAV